MPQGTVRMFKWTLTLQRGTHYSKKQNIHMPGIEKGLIWMANEKP